MGLAEEIADYLHKELCYDITYGSCGRYTRETPHRGYYLERGQRIAGTLEPQIGAANVMLAVRAVVDEMT